MIALVTTTDPKTIVQIFSGVPSSIHLPSGDTVEGVSEGWTGEGLSIVAVTSFVVPGGQQISGSPTYALDGNGNVVETYPTVAIPPVTTIPSLAFRQLFTSAEKLAITTAAETNASLREFLDDEASTETVDLTNPEVTGGIASLVGAGLLTQDRGNQILAGTPAPT